jgi:hypothetical protein
LCVAVAACQLPKPKTNTTAETTGNPKPQKRAGNKAKAKTTENPKSFQKRKDTPRNGGVPQQATSPAKKRAAHLLLA